MASGSLLIACAACPAQNRIPISRIGQSGHCGRCQAELPVDDFYADGPIDVDDARFDLLTRRSRIPVLVDFWASWCQPCLQLEPVIEQLAREFARRLLVVKVDTEQAVSAATRFGVQTIPTLVILRSGLEVDRVSGALPLPALRSRVERFL